MKIHFRRLPGPYGKFAPVGVLCNGWRVALMPENEEFTLEREVSVQLQIRMQNVFSETYVTKATARDLHLECGTSGWQLLDLITPVGMSSFKLYLRETKPRWN